MSMTEPPAFRAGSLAALVNHLKAADVDQLRELIVENDAAIDPSQRAMPQLPGLAIESFQPHVGDGIFGGRDDAYLIGVAGDASGHVWTIPWGQADIEKVSDSFRIHEVAEEGVVSFEGEGLPLVLPPVSGFLALRLLIVDDDSRKRGLADAIKTAADVVGNKDAVGLLVATGLPQAAAVAFVMSQAMTAASKAIAANHDDVIEFFEGFFAATDITADSFIVRKSGATAAFRWITA